MKRTVYLLLAAGLMLASLVTAENTLAANTAGKGASPATASQAQKAGQEATGPARKTDQMVNLNTATASQLTQLPGVGDKTAMAIIEKRTALGGKFTSVDQLLQVKGIGQKKFDKIKPLVSL